MTKPLLCVTVTAPTTAELRRKRDDVADADLIELRLDSVTDPMNKTTTFGYNLQGLRTTVTYPSSGSVTNNYNLMRQLTNVADSAGVNVTTWSESLQVGAPSPAAGLIDTETLAISIGREKRISMGELVATWASPSAGEVEAIASGVGIDSPYACLDNAPSCEFSSLEVRPP